MRAIDELLKMKWESAIRLEGVFDKLKYIKARYFKMCLIDLPRLQQDHPETLKMTEDLNKVYKDILSTEKEINEIGKDLGKLNMLIDTYNNLGK